MRSCIIYFQNYGVDRPWFYQKNLRNLRSRYRRTLIETTQERGFGISSDDRDIGAVTRMDDLKRARIKRGAQRTQATKIWNEAQNLMEGEMNETNVEKLRVILATYDTKIELLQNLDENILEQIQDEKGLETEIAEADDYLTELKKNRYAIEFSIKQSAVHSNSLPNPITATTTKNKHSLSTPSTPPQSQNTNSHRLPKLILPRAVGRCLKWGGR